MFVLQNEPLRPLELAGLKLNPVHVHSGTAKFDLMFSLEETENGLGGFVEYNTDLFDEPTVTRMLGHFQTLLEGVVANPGIKISELPLLPPGEREQMLVEWNRTRAEFPRDKCLHELIEEQARRTPDAVAVVFEDEQLTYRELDRRGDRLAAELRTAGVGPEVRVGICMERSLEMMVGLLGILKAGGGYVPLDPAYPMERLAFMLEDSRASVLLTQPSLRDRFNFEISNLQVLCESETRHESRARTRTKNEDEQTDSTPHSDCLAYVLYTSGSTGRPKGVMVTHRNVVNFFTGMDRVLGLQPGVGRAVRQDAKAVVWLAVTSISFDISVLELFWTLARGFKVVIQPDEKRFRPVSRSEERFPDGRRASVAEQIVRHGVTHLQCTPSLAGALALAPESLEAMRLLDKLLLGGEALPVPLAQKLRQVLRGELINMYGPTETTVWSATHRVAETGNVIPIGRPIANTAIYILDKNRQPVPAGVPGEIFIGGEGVARGYLNQPELTAERFIPNPFGDKSETGAPRLYRTGDLGRFRADGTIEFLGRRDHQVKIRGHRIEPGEIESTLARHPAVREAVVMAREDSRGDRRLVAYAVLKAEIAADELRRFLTDKLPEAMMPSAFVFLEKLPLTPNGKVNRKALPAPPESRPDSGTAYVAPRTKRESAIAGVWQELLHVEQVGLHDNFFDLGGHSLLVVQVQAVLRDRLGIDLPVVKLFQYPTVHSLAGFLNEPGPVSTETFNGRGRRKQAALARRSRQEDEVLA
jgi:amino acid adenylation domain-containing protein